MSDVVKTTRMVDRQEHCSLRFSGFVEADAGGTEGGDRGAFVMYYFMRGS
jgi:hypothetical protein